MKIWTYCCIMGCIFSVILAALGYGIFWIIGFQFFLQAITMQVIRVHLKNRQEEMDDFQ